MLGETGSTGNCDLLYGSGLSLHLLPTIELPSKAR